MSLRMIFDLSFYQKLVAGQHLVKKCKDKPYFQNETLLQVLLLNAEGQNAFCHKTSKTSKKQVSFCHPSKRNEHIKTWETHPNDYRVLMGIF